MGRPITQALAVRDWLPDVKGISYWSRLDSTERCWAVWGGVPVSVTTFPLTHRDEDHLAAVRSVAALFEISLPEPWS